MNTLCKRGGADEPYCSERCYEKGGQMAFAVSLGGQQGRAGRCITCGALATTGKDVAIPQRGAIALFCRKCVESGKSQTHIDSLKECVWCGSRLNSRIPSSSPEPIVSKRRVEDQQVLTEEQVRQFLNLTRAGQEAALQQSHENLLGGEPHAAMTILLKACERSPYPAMLEYSAPAKVNKPAGRIPWVERFLENFPLLRLINRIENPRDWQALLFLLILVSSLCGLVGIHILHHVISNLLPK